MTTEVQHRRWRHKRVAKTLREIQWERDRLARRYDLLADAEKRRDHAAALVDAARDEYHDLRTNPARQEGRGEASWRAEMAFHGAWFDLSREETRVAHLTSLRDESLARVTDLEFSLRCAGG